MHPLRRTLLSLLILALPPLASSQITLPLERYLAATELAVIASDAGGRITTAQGPAGVEIALESRGGALYSLSGEGVFDAETIAEVARLLAAATGFFENIEEPIAQYFRQNLAQLAGIGSLVVGVENFSMRLEVTGEAAPFRVLWSLMLAEVPESAFL